MSKGKGQGDTESQKGKKKKEDESLKVAWEGNGAMTSREEPATRRG